MIETSAVTRDIFSLATHLPLPGLGVLAVNAFVVRAAQPVLVDTGVGATRADFLRALAALVDPADIRWIWLTHTDADHAGNLQAVLDLAPKARLVTTYLGMGKLGLTGMALDRAYLLNPGQELDVGDRRLACLRPVTYDAPETTALLDASSGVYFSADALGAVLPAPAASAAAIAPEVLRAGQIGWATVDAPWLHHVEQARLDATLARVRELRPAHVLSSHLPPAGGSMLETLLANLAAARTAPAFMGPDQAALEAMMAAA